MVAGLVRNIVFGITAALVSVAASPMMSLDAFAGQPDGRPGIMSVYDTGTTGFGVADITPVLSDSSGYAEKYEFFVYTRPYQVRIKFEISNFAFSKNEGKVTGYVKKFDSDGETELAEYKFRKSFGSGEWKAAADGLDLEFGDYRLSFDPTSGMYRLAGTYEKGDFSLGVPANFWKPGTGQVLPDGNGADVFRYGVLTYHRDVVDAVVTEDGVVHGVHGKAYANHYATTHAVYDMFDEVADFRKVTEDLLVEFRYFVPSSKYAATRPFGFMLVAYRGTPVLNSVNISREMLESWTDPANYGYEIASRQRISAVDIREPSNRAVMTMSRAVPEASDPYAGLSPIKRGVASRFASPIEYGISIDWQLRVDVDGMSAMIPFSGSYSMTRLRGHEPVL